MSVLGPSALMDIALPTGVDASYILNFEMRDGMTPQEVIALAATTIGDVNSELETMYGGLVAFTSSLHAKYRQASGSRRKTPIASEFSRSDPVRSATIGHMFTILPYEDATAWSARYLREAHREDVRFDLLEISDSWKDRVDFDIITRMLTNTENVVGSTGYSPGWAIGTGTNLDYIPPDYQGKSFTSSHTHFQYTAANISSSNAATMLKTMAQELAEHGYYGRKVALVSETDISKYSGMTDFVRMIPAEFMVKQGSTDTIHMNGELEGMPGELFGYFLTDHGVVEIRWHTRIPTGYLWMGKSFGVNDMRNPFAIRFNPNVGPNGGGFGMFVKPQVDQGLVPELDHLKFDAEHGVNVNNRLAGVAAEIKTGISGYENPTIS